MFAGLHARLALAQLSAADPDQFDDPWPEEAVLAHEPPSSIGHLQLQSPIGEDLKRYRRGVRTVRHPILDDSPGVLGELVHRDGFDPGHAAYPPVARGFPR